MIKYEMKDVQMKILRMKDEMVKDYKRMKDE